MKIAMPDLISNSHFPAIAAVELGLFAQEGLDATIEDIHPASKAFEALRDGAVDFVAGPAHGMLFAFPEWRGGKLLASLAQGTFWMLVMRSDLGAKRGDLSIVHGKRIAAVPVVELGLRMLLEDSGIDLEKSDVQIVSVPRSGSSRFAAGVAAAKALEEGKIDGFWANATGAELAVRRGVGTIILDVRRGDGPPAAFHYTMPSFATTDRIIEAVPTKVAAAVRAIVETQKVLKRDVRLAAQVGNKVFPPEEAALIGDVIEDDLPYYDATITRAAVDGLNRFTRRFGLIADEASYTDVVATQFSHLWNG
jgi:ABC-type nitrate/sulfonate/bicarbonate transport system substrate-binding protein